MSDLSEDLVFDRKASNADDILRLLEAIARINLAKEALSCAAAVLDLELLAVGLEL